MTSLDNTQTDLLNQVAWSREARVKGTQALPTCPITANIKVTDGSSIYNYFDANVPRDEKQLTTQPTLQYLAALH